MINRTPAVFHLAAVFQSFIVQLVATSECFITHQSSSFYAEHTCSTDCHRHRSNGINSPVMIFIRLIT